MGGKAKGWSSGEVALEAILEARLSLLDRKGMHTIAASSAAARVILTFGKRRFVFSVYANSAVPSTTFWMLPRFVP